MERVVAVARAFDTVAAGAWTPAGVLHRRALAVTICGVALLASCTAREAGNAGASGESPNVLLISIDTLRADRLGLHGYGRHPTSPVIDALGRDGIVHEAHIASSPWTTPSHMSLLTSLHPSSHGVIQSFDEVWRGRDDPGRYVRLGPSRVTLAETLRSAGYRTGAFTGGVTLDPAIGFGRGFDRYSESMYKLGPEQVRVMLDWVAAEPGRPWFLFWHTFETHSPYTQGRFLPTSLAGLRRDLARLTQMIARPDTSATHEGASQVMEELLGRHGVYTAAVCSDLYDGGIASADYWVGRVVAFLLEHDLYDTTLIVLTSDHGEEFADHHPDTFYDGHGHSAYEEVLRVPLVVKLPGSGHSGARVSTVTSGIDVMPTILDVAGVDGPLDQMQGRSLVALWGGGAAADRPAFSEAAAFAEEVKSLRGPRYKLMLEIGPETVREKGRAFVPPVPRRRRLFDLQADPGERRDLLAPGGIDSAADGVAARMEEQMRALIPASPGEVEEIELDDEAVDRLKAMGYVR